MGDTIHRADPLFERQASSVPDLIEALGYLEAGVEVVIPGSEPELVATNAATFVPYRLSVVGHHDLALCRDRAPGFAYVCQQRACRMPASDATTLETQLFEIRGSSTRP